MGGMWTGSRDIPDWVRPRHLLVLMRAKVGARWDGLLENLVRERRVETRQGWIVAVADES